MLHSNGTSAIIAVNRLKNASRVPVSRQSLPTTIAYRNQPLRFMYKSGSNAAVKVRTIE